MKRGRPKKADSLLHRYPPVNPIENDCGTGEDEEALTKETKSEKPRKDIIVALLKKTFSRRRSNI